MNILKEFDKLKPWWEQHMIENQRYGAGRYKKDLYDNIFDKFYKNDFYKDKKVLDIGCNSGGNIVELYNKGVRSVIGIDYNQFFIDQAKLVLSYKKIDSKVIKYTICDQDHKVIEKDLGKFDIIFCLGVIYHMKKHTVEQLFKYMYNCGKRVICSSQIKNSDKRPNVDWDVSKNSIKKFAKDCGFKEIRVLFDETDNTFKNFQRTNQFYFELIHK